MTTLADDLARSLDPVHVAETWEPDPWQADVLRETSANLLLNASRQSGKSTTTSLRGVHTAQYHDGSLVLMVSPSLRQSTELLSKAKVHAERAGFVDEATRTELRLVNGSRILSLPGAEGTIRGFSAPRLIIVDEAARVPDDLYAAIRPMLAVSGGQIIALSTPAGRRGWWHDAWTNGERAWRRVEVPATEVPRITPAFLAAERTALGERMFRQEYLCQFVDSAEAMFRDQWINAARRSVVSPLSLSTEATPDPEDRPIDSATIAAPRPTEGISA